LDKEKTISGLSLVEFKKYSLNFSADIYKILNANTSVNLKVSFGSTNPKLVKQQLAAWQKRLESINARV
jgi:argininosuccinate lyase